MKMKTMTALLLAGAMAASLAACGGSSSQSSAAVEIKGIEDLAGKTVGVQTGTTGDIYVSEEEGITVERYNNGFEATQALSQGKIDAVIIDDQPAQSFVAADSSLKIVETPYTLEDYAAAIALDNTALVEEMNGAISALKENGTLDQIVSFYIEGEGESYVTPEGTAYPNGKLVMGTNAQFPPYEFYNDENKITGIDADFAKAIGDYLGYEVTIEDMQFDSLIPAVSSGKIDFVMAGMTVTEERLKSVNFTDPYYTGKQVIIVKG